MLVQSGDSLSPNLWITPLSVAQFKYHSPVPFESVLEALFTKT